MDMTPQLCTVRAKFDERGFVVIDRSPELPRPSEDLPLLPYLNILSNYGWNAVRGQFDGWEAILYIEQRTENPLKTGSSYMMPMLSQTMLRQSPGSGVLTTTAPLHKQLINQLLDAGEKEGWQNLAGPKQFALLDVLWTISIWVKAYPLP
jgi:hypothetical protein